MSRLGRSSATRPNRLQGRINARRVSNSIAALPPFQRMVDLAIRAAPNLYRTPRRRSATPEPVTCQQPKRKKSRRAKVQAPSRDINLAERRLMPREPDAQPSLVVERDR